MQQDLFWECSLLKRQGSRYLWLFWNSNLYPPHGHMPYNTHAVRK